MPPALIGRPFPLPGPREPLPEVDGEEEGEEEGEGAG